MKVIKKTVLLLAILLVGVLAVIDRPASAQQQLPLPGPGAIRSSCNGVRSVNGSRLQYGPQGCDVVGQLLGSATSSSLAQIAQAIGNALELPSTTTCDQCLTAVTTLESGLATNNTASAIASALDQACAKTYSDFTTQQQCVSYVNAVTVQTVDFILSTAPPLTACRLQNFCPAQ